MLVYDAWLRMKKARPRMRGIESPPQNLSLTVTATGRSGERVTSSPAGLSVGTGTTGSANFASGASVTLSVTNGRDAIWSGACSSGGATQKPAGSL